MARAHRAIWCTTIKSSIQISLKCPNKSFSFGPRGREELLRVSVNKPYDFYQCSSPEITNNFFAGYKTQIEAGCGVLCQIGYDQKLETENSEHRILIFGMPGTGKSLYSEALMKYACENIKIQTFLKEVCKKNRKANPGFSLFYVSCLGLLTNYATAASLRPVLSLLERRIDEKTPAIVVLDELDAFSPEHREQAEYLSYWTMNFMKRKHHRLLIFGIVNYPDKLDLAVYRKFEHMFYFDLPNEETVAEILEHSKIPYYQEIARRICTQPVDVGELMNGCDYTVKFKGNGDHKNLQKMDPDDLAEVIGQHLKITWDQVRDYRNKYDDQIGKAIQHMTLWKEQMEKLLTKASK